MRAFAALTRVLLGAVVTRGRLVAVISLGVLGMGVALAIGQGDPVDPTQSGADLVNAFGLSVFVPVVVLVLSSATLGDPIEDSSLGYLWLRPVPRATLAAAAVAAALAITLPLSVVPLVAMALLAGGSAGLVGATVLATALTVIAYAGIFVALGSVAKRALTWGVLYILVWEGFVARAGTASSRFSVQYYARSALAEVGDVTVSLAGASLVVAVAVPVVVVLVGVALTTVRLHRIDVA
ncbi:MAG: ABC transporter permease [Acidimicrobiales bacterium]